MAVFFTGPGQVWTASTAAATAAVPWTLIGTTAETVTVERLAWSIAGTTGSMGAFNGAWTGAGAATGRFPQFAGYNCPPPPTEAQQAAWRRENEQRRAVLQVAGARASQLLLSVLSPAEAESYTRLGWFEVRGSGGGWWRIRRDGQAGNIEELERPGGPRIASWCCHPPGGLPDADAHLAQLLHLVTDEDGFRATGNRTPRRRLAAAWQAPVR